MTVETQVDDQTSQNDVRAEENNQTQTVRDPEAVLRKNQELLAKQRKAKEEAEKYRREAEELKQKELERQGKFEEALKAERERRERAEKERQEASAKYAYNTVVTQIKERAMREGCTNPDKLIKLADSSDLDMVDYDDDYRVDQSTLENFITKMKQENEFLFKKQPNHPRDLPPGSSAQDFSSKRPNIYDMSRSELSGLYAKIREKELRGGR